MPVKRPDSGSAGKAIQVRTNFFPVLSLPNTVIHHYAVSIQPDVPPAKNRQIFLIWESLFEDEINGVKPVYDGRHNMYAPIPLFEHEMASFEIEYFDEDEFPECENPTEKDLGRIPKLFELTFTKIADISLDQLRRFLKGFGSEPPVEAMEALDVVLRHRPSLMFSNVGRCFYTPDAAQFIANGATLWQGFHQSLRATKGGLLINLDVSATAFYQAGPVTQIVLKILNRTNPMDIRNISDRDVSKIERQLKGLKIVVTHRGQIRRKYKITKCVRDARQTKFALNDTKEIISVYDFFLKKFKIALKYPHLPCIMVGDANRPMYFPMEVCEIVPGQRHVKKLNERQTAEMIKFTCQPPHIRSNKIATGMTLMQQQDDEYLQDFGLEIGSEMLTIPARILPAPVISYHPASKEPLITPKDGAWNLRDKMVAQGVSLVSWAVLVFAPEKEIPLSMCQKFITTLVDTCEECGVFVESKQPPISYANPNGNIEQTIIDSYMVAGNTYQSRPQLLLCILPNTGVPLYAEIKRAADTVVGVATQCIQGKHLQAAKRQYCANVCLKINVKLGGMNSYLSTSQLPFISDKPTIVLGADVTHPAIGSSSTHSIAALVGSLDAQCSRYSAAIRTQTGRVEWIQDLSGMVVELLRTFYQTCGIKPERIIMYRDAVSESQFSNVSQRELKSIKEACDSLEPGYSPKITYIAVQKRHHARFFPIKREDTDKSGNVLPGTVVESRITHPSEFDFYLCSHGGLQGTSKPTHYHVLHDENHIGSDTLQALTYRMCYLYCRATRSVSVSPPIYYAHLVATRARFHSKDLEEGYRKGNAEKTFGTVKEELSRVMYFM